MAVLSFISRRRLHLWALVAAVVLVVSCKEQHNGAVVADVSPGGWQVGESVELRYNNTDTLGLYDLWVVARAEVAREGQTVCIGVECMSPDSVVVAGEVVLEPQVAKGGTLSEVRSLWVADAQLHKQGEYILRLKNVGTESVEGLWTVGVDFMAREN